MSALTGSVTTTDGFDRATRKLLPALHGYARRLTRDPTQSEDLVQETLLRAWAARHRFIPDSNMKAWLFRIEFNCFVSTLRKSRRVVQLSPEMADLGLTTPAMQEEGLMARDFVAALAALPPVQAEALVLINGEQIPYETAAERLRIPVGTVKSRTTRARAAVVRFLSENAVPRDIACLPKILADREDAALEAVRPACENARYVAWKASGARMIG